MILLFVLAEVLEHAVHTHTLPRDDEDAVPLKWIRGHPNIGPVLEVKVTYPLYPYGIELRFESLKKDGSQSWIVICRGRNKYVDKLHEEKGDSVYYEEMATGSGTAKPVATKQKG